MLTTPPTGCPVHVENQTQSQPHSIPCHPKADLDSPFSYFEETELHLHLDPHLSRCVTMAGYCTFPVLGTVPKCLL
jgi:hypothetical protein